MVNDYAESDLAALIARNGEERYARRIAAEIVAARPLQRTGELVEAIKRAIPAPARRRGGHPARRTFQAIRMEVNRELPNLAAGLDESVHLLGPRGREIVLAYHSLEDRMVKERFADWSRTEEPGHLRAACPARRATRSPSCSPGDRSGRPRPRSPPTPVRRARVCGRSSGSDDRRRGTRPSDPAPARPRGSSRTAPRPYHDPTTRTAPRAARARESPPRRVLARVPAPVSSSWSPSVFVLVSAVLFHVVLAQGQLQLDRLDEPHRDGTTRVREAAPPGVDALRRRSGSSSRRRRSAS